MKTFLIVLFFLSPALGATFHVAPQGSDITCDGSVYAPIGNGKCSFATIQKGIDMAAADGSVSGDTIYVHAGTYTASNCAKDAGLGQVTTVARITGYQNSVGCVQKPLAGSTNPLTPFTIWADRSGGEVIIDCQGGDTAFFVSRIPNVIIQEFKIQNCKGGVSLPFEYGGAITVYKSPGVILRGNTVKMPTNAPIDKAAIYYATDSQPMGGKITGNILMSHGELGIVYSTTGPVAKNDNGEVSSNSVTLFEPLPTGDACAALSLKRMDGARVLNNTFMDYSTSTRNPIGRGMYLRDTEGLQVIGNTILGFAWGIYIQDTDAANAQSTATSRGYQFEFEQMKMTGNTFIGPEPNLVASYAIPKSGGDCNGCVIQNNIVEHYDNGFTFRGNTDSPAANATNTITSIANNIFFDVSGPALSIFPQTVNGVVLNNTHDDGGNVKVTSLP